VITERAKGILMERHGVDDHAALQMLRAEAQSEGRALIDAAQTVIDGVRLASEPPSEPLLPAV
jgi:AmiR/NasT family two-component response regulator